MITLLGIHVGTRWGIAQWSIVFGALVVWRRSVVRKRARVAELRRSDARVQRRTERQEK